MRFYEKSQIILSKDTVSEPKQIRLSEAYEDVDIESLSEAVIRDEKFAIGSHVIAFEQVDAPKLVVIKPTAQDIQVSLNGDPAKTFLKDKLSKMWISGLTSLSITISTTDTQVLVAVAG